MIKIIENPEPVKCENCGCVFTFDKEDVKTDWYWDPQAFLGILGLSKRCEGVRCPICNHLYVIRNS